MLAFCLGIYMLCTNSFAAPPGLLQASALRNDTEGMFWAGQGDYVRSREHLEQAVLESPYQLRFLLHLAWASRFAQDYPRAVVIGVRVYALAPDSGVVHDELWRLYSALGRREGYDQEIVLRGIYHLEKAFESGRLTGDNDPEAIQELKFLLSMESRLEEASHHTWGVRILAEGTDPASVALWRIESLPDDGVSRKDQFKVMDRAISRQQDWDQQHKNT